MPQLHVHVQRNPGYLLPGEDLTAFHRRRNVKTRDAKCPFLPGRRQRDEGPITNVVKKTGEVISKASQAIERHRAGDDEVTEQGTPPQNNLNHPFGIEGQEVRVIGTLDPAPEGMMYQLEQRDDGSIALMMVPDDGGEISTADRTYRHRLADGPDPILQRMNKKNRAHHSRTRDADTVRRTIYKHNPLHPDDRLELQTNPDGSVEIILISPVTRMNDIPIGAQPLTKEDDEQEPVETTFGWSSASGVGEPSLRELSKQVTKDGYTPLRSEAAMLRHQNNLNREFWRRR